MALESSCVPTEVGYSTKFDSKPTPYQLKNIGNAGKIRFCLGFCFGEKFILKGENKKLEKEIIHLQKQLHTGRKRR